MPREHVPLLVQLVHGFAHMEVVADRLNNAAAVGVSTEGEVAGGLACVLAAAALFFSVSFIWFIRVF